MMYIANHNLNTEISLAGTSLLVPTTALLNQTNAFNGSGSLGLMASKILFGSISASLDPLFELQDLLQEQITHFTITSTPTRTTRITQIVVFKQDY